VLDIAMSKVRLKRSGVVTLVGQRVAAGMGQHVRVCLERPAWQTVTHVLTETRMGFLVKPPRKPAVASTMRSAIYPYCDVAIFPSIVAEAGPLVLIEAMASGCYPMGTYFAGMGANIDIAASALIPNRDST
jgi:hypothetical protein